MRGRPAALAVAATLALAGCGGSEESDEGVQGPTTVPTTATPTTTTTTPTTPMPEPAPSPYSTEEQAPGEGDGGGGPPGPDPSAPRGDDQTGGARPPEDSPENDTAPDPDSPAGRYERYGDENPGACE